MTILGTQNHMFIVQFWPKRMTPLPHERVCSFFFEKKADNPTMGGRWALNKGSWLYSGACNLYMIKHCLQKYIGVDLIKIDCRDLHELSTSWHPECSNWTLPKFSNFLDLFSFFFRLRFQYIYLIRQLRWARAMTRKLTLHVWQQPKSIILYVDPFPVPPLFTWKYLPNKVKIAFI